MIITALDFPDRGAVFEFVDRIDPSLTRLKVGKELFTAEGPALVRDLVARGYEVFLDLKFHDIPNTVAAALRVAIDLGVWMVNVHASGGSEMLAAAREAVPQGAAGTAGPTLLVAVTVLTSLDDEQLNVVGVKDGVEAQVRRLAALASAHDLDGVVCAPREAALVHEVGGAGFLAVTPGIRPAVVDDDQRRTLTPAEAVQAGCDWLVIGRPITQSPDPATTLEALVAEVSAARHT